MYLAHIMKKKVMKQILIFFIIILSTFASTYVLMMQSILTKQDELMDMFTSTMKVSIEESYRIANREEHAEEQDLYIKLMGIGKDLATVPLSELSNEMLYAYRDEYNLSHISIFNKDDKDEISIMFSTHPQEIGIKTNRWGFWNEAFLQLYRDGTVTLDKGVAKDNFWVGPKSYSYVDYKTKGVKNYFKYAYYFNEDQRYIINAITSEESYSLNGANRLNALLDEFSTRIKSIEKFGVINLKNWSLSAKKSDRNDNLEPIVSYGNITTDEFLSFDIRQSVVEDLGHDETKYIDVTYRGKPYKLSFSTLEDNIICTLISQSYFQELTLPFFLGIIAISLIISIVISLLIRKEARKSDILLRSEQQRLKAVEEFKNAITNVPDYIFRMVIDADDQLMVTFNEGRLVKDNNYIGVGNEPKPLYELYSQTFITTATPYIHQAFANNKVSFEYEENNTCYEIIIIPDKPDESNQVSEILCFVNDVTKYVMDIQHKTYMAHHDELTGLLNRRQFNLDFERYETTYKRFAIYYLDLDGFKSVNDRYGHKAGDFLLQQIAERLNKLKATTTYRIGGDEFLIVLPCKQQRESSKMASTIVDTINQPITLPTGIKVQVGVSIGISIYPVDSKDKEQLINYADQAMYHTKREGKNAFFYYG